MFGRGSSAALHGAARPSRMAQSIRALRLPPTSIARASADCWQRIDGTVGMPEGEKGLITPCGGEPAVWVRLRVHRTVASGGGPNGGRLWVTVFDETEASRFEVMDPEATTAAVVTRHARVVTRRRTYFLPKEPPRPQGVDRKRFLDEEAQARVGDFASRRGNELWLGEAYEEQWISPGDRVSVIGFAQRLAGSPTATAYRESPSSVLVLEGTPERPLFIARSSMGFAPHQGAAAAWWSRLHLFLRSL